jgi:hypothetical protein
MRVVLRRLRDVFRRNVIDAGPRARFDQNEQN